MAGRRVLGVWLRPGLAASAFHGVLGEPFPEGRSGRRCWRWSASGGSDGGRSVVSVGTGLVGRRGVATGDTYWQSRVQIRAAT